MIYLDYCANTPADPAVLPAFLQAEQTYIGNPTANHPAGQAAREAMRRGGAAAGIAYLHGGGYDVIAHTIANTLAICSGMICDGAKPSCAAKIAAAVNAGLTGYQMYLRGGRQFFGGEGIIKKGVENTISSVGRLARCGMRETDAEILDIMVGR